MFTIIAGIILRYRILLLFALIIITAFMGYKAREIKLSYEHAALLPETDSSFIEYKRYSDIFGEDGNIVVIGIQNTSFFNLEPLADWFEMISSIEATGLDIKKSVSSAIRKAGVSLLYTSIILFFGFGIFSLSGFGGTVALGILISFTLLIAVTSNLILLPSMLLSMERIIIKRNFHEPLMHLYDDNGDEEFREEGESTEQVKEKKLNKIFNN